jgi:hypothetical protein
MDVVEQIILKSNDDKCKKYLESRKITISLNNIKWADNVLYGDKMISGLFIFIYNSTGGISLIEHRDPLTETYNKIIIDKNSVPIYIDDKNSKNVVITESVLDAVSISQFQDITTVSLLRASFNLYQLAYLYYKFHNKKWIILFDNDDAGKTNTERLIKIANKSLYKKDITTRDFPHNDLNEFLCKSPSLFKAFTKSLRQ